LHHQPHVRRKETGSNWAIAKCGSECPVFLDDFLKWIKTTPDIDNVGTATAKYPASYQKRFFLARSPTVFSTNVQVMSSVTQTSSVQ
ncbi:hypothetical protein L915_12225, partial [Phytophthora nicotianae]